VNFAAPMTEIARLIKKQVFSEATYKTQDALAAIDCAHKDREEGDQTSDRTAFGSNVPTISRGP
jgi:hypothetical protein